MTALANHLWQSTLFAAVAALLTLALARQRAQVRYCIWLAASFKFLIPFSLLVSLGSRFQWRSAPQVAPPLTLAVEQISQPFSAAPLPGPAASSLLPNLLAALWISGGLVILFRWFVRWRSVRRALRTAVPVPVHAPIAVMSSPSRLEPGIFGVVRPVLLLPEGIADRLTPAQFQAILAHELCHVRRRDNLAAALHMVVEVLFWFHPLVWWIGARLIDERERACDQEVLRQGSAPEAYAEGILNVCKFYLESPLPCASGVTGADLKKRIAAIMTDRAALRLTLAAKLLLVAAGIAAVAGPILIGIVNPAVSRAQSNTGALTFEAAAIKPPDPNARVMGMQFLPGGGIKVQGIPLKSIVAFAYEIQSFQISGGPAWMDSQRFDILATSPPSAEPAGAVTRQQQTRTRQRLQSLLAERFHLVIRRDMRELPVYVLTVARTGPKMKETELQDGIRQAKPGEILGLGTSLENLAVVLARMVGRPVLDKTGLAGRYEFTLTFTQEPGMNAGPEKPGPLPPPADSSGPSLFTAMQEQLGLRLDAQKGPVETIVIERVEKPTEN